jgi:hypothetical protein
VTDTVTAAATAAAEPAGADGHAAAIPGLVGRRAAHGHAGLARPGEAAFPDLLGAAMAGKVGAGEKTAAAGTPEAPDGAGAELSAPERQGRPSPRPSPRKRGEGEAEPDAAGSAVHAEISAAAAHAPSHTPQGSPHAAAPAPAKPVPAKVAPPQGQAIARASSGAGKPQAALPSTAKPAAEENKDRERGRELRAGEAPAAARLEAPAAPPAAATLDRAAVPRTATAVAAPPAPVPAPPPGQDVQGSVLRSAAHLKVDGGALGAVELHLRVREGAIHLRVDGDAARVVEARAGELSRALAREGLTLAPIEPSARDAGTATSGEGGRGFEERRDAWREATDARERAPSGDRTPARARGTGARTHHVKA